jgi:rhodanese-related sulfurtransferase
MKTFIWQFLLISALSLVIAFSYNQFVTSTLPLFRAYVPEPTEDLNALKSHHFDEIDAETLMSLTQTPNIVLLDARQSLEYLQSHIPGAISFPIAQFQLEYDVVKPLLIGAKTIIIYCSDLSCLDSTYLAINLVKKGHANVLIYKGGMADWQQQGNPVEPSKD